LISKTNAEFRPSATDNGIGISPDKIKTVVEPFLLMTLINSQENLGGMISGNDAWGALVMTSSGNTSRTFTLSLSRFMKEITNHPELIPSSWPLP
jgi:hypothetical protein